MPVPDGRMSPARWYALAVLVIVLDQISKQVVLANIRFGETIYVAPFWNWVLTFNRGAAFSFLASEDGWQRWFFTVLAVGVSAWIVHMLRQHAEQKLLSFSLALIMGGALGNVIDRIRFGAVVDFIDVSQLWFPWIFNVADAAIVLGVLTLVADALFRPAGSVKRSAP